MSIIAHCTLPMWPVSFFGAKFFMGILAIAGIVFSLIMLIDCLKRPGEKFYNPLTKTGEYDKLIWAAAIIVSLSFYFLGAIAYYFVVKRAKPQSPGE